MGHELAANSERGVRFLPSFFFREIADARRGGERSFVDPSPTLLSGATRLESAYGFSPEIPGVSGWIGSRRRRPFRETGVIGVQTKPLARGISPTRFTDFFLSWMEFKRFRSTCYSPRFFHFSLSLSESNKRSYKTISSFRYLNICSRTTFHSFLLLKLREILAYERLIFEEMVLSFDRKSLYIFRKELYFLSLHPNYRLDD